MRRAAPTLLLALALLGASGPAAPPAAQGGLLHEIVVSRLREAVDGTVRLERVRLASWNTVEARGLEIADRQGRPVIAALLVRATISPLDLLRGRYLVRDVQLVRPVVDLRQDAEGRWNIARLFRSGPATPGARRPLVDFRDVRVTAGAVTLQPAGRARPIRMTALALDLRRLRVSHPDSTGLTAEVRDLAVRVSDPAVQVRQAWGHVVVDGDSVSARLDAVRLPGSLLTLRGVLHTGGPRTAFAVSVNAQRFRFEDLAWIAPELPRSGGGSLVLVARTEPDGRGSWEVRGAEVTSGGSQLRGAVRLEAGGGRTAHIGALDVTASPLDLALLEPLVPGLPLRGTVAGRVQAAGPLDALEVTADLAFTDSAAAGRPVSRLSGRGRLALGGRVPVVFRRFTVPSADIALATIERLAPAVSLHGRLRLNGTLEGPWTDAGFTGTLTHVDGPGPASTLRGAVHLTLRDTVGLLADVTADSVSFDDLRRTWPGIPLRGAVAGHARVEGPVTALTVDADLAGPSGRIVVGGTVGAGDSAVGARVQGRFEGVDLALQVPGAPPTALAGGFGADLRAPTADTLAPTTGTVQVTLDRSRVAGTPFERGGLRVTLDADGYRIDTLFAQHAGGYLEGTGSLGRPGAPAGRLTVAVRVDTLASFAPLIRWLRRQAGDSAALPLELDGAGRLDGQITGTTAAWEARGELHVATLTFGDLDVRALHAGWGWVAGPGEPALHLVLALDSLATAGLRYGAITVGADGPLDSVATRLQAALPLDASLRLSGLLDLGAAVVRARVDTADVRVPGTTWKLTTPLRVAFARESLTIDTVDLHSSAGGRVRGGGSLPLLGAGDFRIAADSVPLADLFILAERDTAGVGGILSLSARLTGSKDAPAIESYVSLADGRFGDFRTPLLDGLVRYGDSLLTLKGTLWRGHDRVLGVRGSLPLDLGLGAVPRRQLAGPLEIRVEADSVDLAAMDAFTTLVRDVRGQFSADLGVGGTWDQPVLTGGARIGGGALTIPTLGVRWDGIALRLETAGNRIHLAEARLHGGNGTLDVQGDVVLQDLTRPVLDLTLDARGFEALNQRDFAGVTGTGMLRLTGPFLGATLTGSLTVDEGYLAFADLVEKRLVNLDDPEFRAVVDSNLARAAELGPPPEVIFLDSLRIDGLRVVMGPSVWLRSTEANIQLSGDFTVSKSAESALNPYRLDGTLRAVRGTYRLTVGPASKDFSVTQGEVRFFGTPDLNPQLDITAEHTVRAVQGTDLAVRAHIGGTLLEPRLSLESDQRPPLSETEIVSYLLFGRPSFDLLGGRAAGTRSEQAVLQGAMMGIGAALAAGQLEQALVADLGLPLDYIAIRPGAVGDVLGTTRVEAGTRIGERTFLTVNAPLCEVRRGLSSQLFGATVEYRLTGRWRFEASVEPLLQECRAIGIAPQPSTAYQIGVDLFWQRGVP